jgi:hypothetical protein
MASTHDARNGVPLMLDGRSPARTDYLAFEGRPHRVVVGEGWEVVAAAIDGWLDGLAAAAPPAS